jgi:hypothetical protein
MALLSWVDLTVTEQRLYEAAADGQLLDLTTGLDCSRFFGRRIRLPTD